MKEGAARRNYSFDRVDTGEHQRGDNKEHFG
jgi:hypothetical protein